jgi:hypothetical protein
MVPVATQSRELKAEYESLVIEINVSPEIGKQKTSLAAFITDKKPLFPEPYADLWNLSLSRHGIAKVSALSDGRVRKFETRIKEQAFDFIKILTEINKSEYLQGKKTNWKVDWDWVFENDTNYLKVIEGKY